ncbi:MAG: acyltransferase [Ruminococcus sp.]|nr:acyltransferase [Ruminococcus sp.]
MSKNKKTQPDTKAENETPKQTEPPKATELRIRKADTLDKPYFAGIDILKIIAVLFVIWVHTFLYNGFYSAKIDSEDYMLPIALRWIAYTCVPIFMTITGYLMKNKKFSGKYYLGILRVLIIYIVVSIICMKYKQENFNNEFTTWTVLKGFFHTYDLAQYGWYMNYYFAIFAMIPFLNSAFNGLKNKKERLALVVTIFVFTILARSLFIGMDPDKQFRLLPDYLAGFWPVAYYFTGAYIREYPPKRCLRNKFLYLLVLIAAVVFLTQSTYNHSLENIDHNNVFMSRHFNDYGTYPVFIAAVCIFLLFFDITTTKRPVKFVLRQLGDATFCTYLLSYVFDQDFYLKKFYPKYPNNLPDGSWNFERFNHSYEGIIYVFIRAMFWALVIQNIYNLIEFLVKLAAKKLKENYADEEASEQILKETQA